MRRRKEGMKEKREGEKAGRKEGMKEGSKERWGRRRKEREGRREKGWNKLFNLVSWSLKLEHKQQLKEAIQKN